MKKFIPAIVAAVLVFGSCSTLNYNYLMQGGTQALQAASITDDQIKEYVAQYVTQLDAQNTVLPESNAYVKRLRKLTSGLTSVDGTPLNFKVYKTNDVNAFACADGSVRVYTGLMDLMNDNEVLGVIGHEIGHVALKHTKKQMQSAILTSAAMTGLASTGETMAALTQSQLGAIGEAVMSAKFSRKHESQADDFAYDFLKGAGKNPVCLMQGFEKLQSLEKASSSTNTELVNNLFSSHPATADRIKKIHKKLLADGYVKE